VKIAAVQLHCSPDSADNLDRAATAIASAAQQGADLVVLPELFSSLGRASAMRDAAQPLDGTFRRWAGDQARVNHCALVAGSFVERNGEDLFNTSIAIDADGSLLGSYRKIHLFDVEVTGVETRESATFASGSGPQVVTFAGVRVGLTICYDLRFPELYRAEALDGADIILVPAAFTATTGRDHWEVLLRARAIENQAMLVAAAQWGTSPDGIERHGHSLIVDGWGRILAEAPTQGDTVLVAEFNASIQHDIRTRLPVSDHRRPDTYGPLR